MGLSGSGKSTLVRCLSRLVEPSFGEILLDGKDLRKAAARELIELRRHAMGMVFQNFGLMPHLTVLENVAFPLRIQKQTLAERERRGAGDDYARRTGGPRRSYPHQLSGGQQQRVGIARSLAVGPELWFLDEPFSALDPLIRRQMQDEFLRSADAQENNRLHHARYRRGLPACRPDRADARGQDHSARHAGRIVLNPADSYVAQFTEDVPLMRVITAGDLLER